MDPRISRLSQMGPARSRSSVATSDTTYHSFHDVELFPPASPPKDTNKTNTTTTPSTPKKENQRPHGQHPSSTEMKRQDSGYESNAPRTSFSQPRRTSTASSSGSGPHTPRTRPSSRPGRPVIRRSPQSSPYPARPPMTQIQAFHNARSQPNHPSSFFHFPAHPTDLSPPSPAQQQPEPEVTRSVPSPPPQPTHYWTSDRTRRLEYAAIDAAHQGLKGWVRRHLVPDCFIPKEKTPVAFDDETGSVRRYRMELEEEAECKERKAWAWGRIKSW